LANPAFCAGQRDSIDRSAGAEVLAHPTRLAKSAVEVGETARSIAVSISAPSSNGSGILLKKQGDVYTILTAAHVVKNSRANYKITTPDGRTYQPIANSIRSYRSDIDLAVLKFRSSANYKLAELGDSNQLKSGMDIYVAGFPLPTRVITESVFVFREGKVTANSKRVFKNGYGLLYSNDTLPGMSGGPVLNASGQVVGVHGRGDREEATGEKTGFNAGIPIGRFADIAQSLGLKLDGRVARISQNTTLTADDYFVSANQKNEQQNYRGALADYNQAISLKPEFADAYISRGNLKYQKLDDFQGALADHNQAVSLNPKYAKAYYHRGILKYLKLNDFQGALADYNQSISLNPKYAKAYYHRGILKYQKLNDFQGALADYNQSISLSPKSVRPYASRGNLKYQKLNDAQGALADYNQALSLDPNYLTAYIVRGNLKYQKLNDFPGALADYNQALSLDPKSAAVYVLRGRLKNNKFNDRRGAISDYRAAARIFRQQGQTSNLQRAIDQLRKLGATE
jgi:tetratricopeptide (TPR) repeat protein